MDRWRTVDRSAVPSEDSGQSTDELRTAIVTHGSAASRRAMASNFVVRCGWFKRPQRECDLKPHPRIIVVRQAENVFNQRCRIVLRQELLGQQHAVFAHAGGVIVHRVPQILFRATVPIRRATHKTCSRARAFSVESRTSATALRPLCSASHTLTVRRLAMPDVRMPQQLHESCVVAMPSFGVARRANFAA